MNPATADNQNLPLLPALGTIVLCTAFGANAVAIKISLSGLGVFTTAGLRFAIASAAIFVWARLKSSPLLIARHQVAPLGIASAIFTLQLSLFYMGISMTSASRAALIVNLMPFFLLVLAHFFIPGEPITFRKGIGILLGFSGVLIVFGQGAFGAGWRRGDLLVMLGALTWAINAVYVKRIISGYSAFQVVLYPMCASVPIFFLGAIWLDPVMVGRIDGPVLGALAYQSLLTASLGFIAWNTLLKKYGATALHSFIFVMPVSGVLFSNLLLNEPVTLRLVVALAAIASGIVVIHAKHRKTGIGSLEKRRLS
jgi:drug/metabolite transporter (DMT)-like permease